jgi:hypothetical protein
MGPRREHRADGDVGIVGARCLEGDGRRSLFHPVNGTL